MDVVIVGARERSESKDFGLVNSLIDELKKVYSDLFIITTGTDRGVGKIIKNRLMAKDPSAPPEVPFLEIAYKIFAQNRTKAFFAKKYETRNRALLAVGEEFHILLDEDSHSVMQYLADDVKDAGLPMSLYHPGDNAPKILVG